MSQKTKNRRTTMETNEMPKCPKCHTPLQVNGMKDRLNCATHLCQFGWCYMTPEEWAGVRYVTEPAVKPASDKPRRMQGNPGRFTVATHWDEHDENEYCQHLRCLPVEPVADKPVAPIIPKLLSGASEPDPGEGYRLIDQCIDTPQEGDEVWLRPDGLTFEWIIRGERSEGVPYRSGFHYRRRIEPPAPEWEDVAIRIGEHTTNERTVAVPGQYLKWIRHTDAPSMRGFMGFVYADGLVTGHTVRQHFGKSEFTVEFPIAVRFAKEAK
jgi:hypothetical protein